MTVIVCCRKVARLTQILAKLWDDDWKDKLTCHQYQHWKLRHCQMLEVWQIKAMEVVLSTLLPVERSMFYNYRYIYISIYLYIYLSIYIYIYIYIFNKCLIILISNGASFWWILLSMNVKVNVLWQNDWTFDWQRTTGKLILGILVELTFTQVGR